MIIIIIIIYAACTISWPGCINYHHHHHHHGCDDGMMIWYDEKASLEDIRVASTEVRFPIIMVMMMVWWYCHQDHDHYINGRITVLPAQRSNLPVISVVIKMMTMVTKIKTIITWSHQVVSVVGSRRTTGRSQSAERILDEERAFTRAELVIIIIVIIIIIIIIRVIMMVMAMVMIIGVSAVGTPDKI